MGMFTPITTATASEHFNQNGEMSDSHLAAVRLGFLCLPGFSLLTSSIIINRIQSFWEMFLVDI